MYMTAANQTKKLKKGHRARVRREPKGLPNEARPWSRRESDTTPSGQPAARPGRASKKSAKTEPSPEALRGGELLTRPGFFVWDGRRPSRSPLVGLNKGSRAISRRNLMIPLTRSSSQDGASLAQTETRRALTSGHSRQCVAPPKKIKGSFRLLGREKKRKNSGHSTCPYFVWRYKRDPV